MRVRQLHTYLQETGMYIPVRPEDLRGLRVGIEASWWLRSIHLLKDPFGDALGGCSPAMFEVVRREIEWFLKYEITPVFVFDGVIPQCQNGMFQRTSEIEAAWIAVAQKLDNDAQKKFAVSTSRFNSDVAHFVFHFLKSLNTVEVFRAPYLASAQLAYMAESQQIQSVLGQPGLMMFGIRRIVTSLDFANGTGEFADLEFLLSMWQISKLQFVDACILAGNEYSLTFPFLNLDKFHGGNWSFQTAVDLARQLAVVHWVGSIPDEKNRIEAMHSYAVTKALLLHTPVFKLASSGDGSWEVAPLTTVQVPEDFEKLIGNRMTNEFYVGLSSGALSHRIPQVIGTGEWIDRTPPLVDSEEYRALFHDLAEYRLKALCLGVPLSGTQFKEPVFKTYYGEPQTIGVVQAERGAQLKWRVTKEQIAAEMKRQGVEHVDVRFCLRWHCREAELNGALVRSLRSGDPHDLELGEPLVVQTVTLFTFLEALDMFSTEGGVTVLGDVLKDTPVYLQEPMLLAFELMKFGVLTGEPLEPAAGHKYPAALKYGETAPAETLLTRILSLCPMKYKAELWNAPVDFDLANFHGLVRIINRSMRLLMEASLTALANKDVVKVFQAIPATNLFNPVASANFPSDFVATGPASGTASFLPALMLPRTCLGIVAKFMFEYAGAQPHSERGQFEQALKKRFPCCVDPLKDLKTGIKFFKEIVRCVSIMAEQLEAQQLLLALQDADALLDSKRKLLGL